MVELTRFKRHFLFTFLIFTFYTLYPFQNISPLGLSYLNLKFYYLIFVAILCVLLILIFLKKLPLNKGIIYFFLPYGIFITWIIFSNIWSVTPHYSIHSSVKYFVYMLIGISLALMLVNFHFVKMLKIIALSICISAAVVSTIYIIKFLDIGGMYVLLNKDVSMSSIAQIASINVGFGGGRNLLASWLVFSLTFSLPLIIKYFRNKLVLMVVFLLTVIIILVVVLTLSRTSQLALMFFTFLMLFFSKNTYVLKVRKYVIASVFGILVFIVIFNPLNISKFLIGRFIYVYLSLTGAAEDYGTEGRIELWKYALKAISENFWEGTGIGTLYNGLLEIDGVHNYHNIFLQFFAQTGVIGFSLFMFWTIWIFYVAKRLKDLAKGNLEYEFVTEIIYFNLIIYYFKSLLMFQYFDMEIWTLLPVLASMYALYRNGGKNIGRRGCINTSLQ